MQDRKKIVKRILVYAAGTAILLLGITLNTKTGFGVSTGISVAYVVSQLTGIAIGTCTFGLYVLYVLLQWLMLRKAFRQIEWLQVVVALVSSLLVQFYSNYIPDAKSMAARIIVLIVAIVLTGIGAALTVQMRIMPNPADGLADVIGQKLHKNLGFGKNVFDLTCVVISVALGLIVEHRLVGIGIGTLCSMVFTGRVVAVANGPAIRLYRKIQGMEN